MPTKLTRTEMRQQETRLRLRRSAHELMTTAGVDGITIQQITDAADIGFGTFYNYYESKDDLAQDVLDCLIHNLGERNDLVTRELGETDPVRIVANSVRFVIRELVEDPVYRWWFQRLDLLVDRMRIGFAPFGLRDVARAVEAGRYHLVDDDPRLAWSQLVWLMTAGAADVLSGEHDRATERGVVEGILRVMGVDHASAREATASPRPEAPPLPVDFARERTP